MQLNKKSAFSLIELSIVVLVIGLIVVAVIGGKKLVTLSNLSKARALTNSSPVAGTENLGLWLETTSKDSFLAGQNIDGTEVLTWRDINPQNNNKRSATGVTTTVPLYTANAINGLPALRFDGVGSFFNYDGSFLINSDFTIFIVDQRRAGGNLLMIGGGNSSTTLQCGYNDDSSMSFGTNSTASTSGTVPTYSTPVPRISRFVLSSVTSNNQVVINGSQNGTYAGLSLLTAYTSPYIGRQNTTYYNGDIGEIIIFTRVLSDFEAGEIEKYLSKKWGIKLS